MSWLYGQTWLWYLIAFLVGLLLAWLVFVRPQQRRLKALLAATGSTGAPNVAAGSRATSAARDEPTGTRTDPPAESLPVIDAAGDAPTELIPVVDAAPDSPTDVFPAVDPALNTLDTARVTAADAATPLPGMATVPAADDAPTPPEGIPATATAEDQQEADLIPDEPMPDTALGDDPSRDPTAGDEPMPDAAVDEPSRPASAADAPVSDGPHPDSPAATPPSQPAAQEAEADPPAPAGRFRDEQPTVQTPPSEAP